MACLLLNLTTRKQVDKVIDNLFNRYPNPRAMASANEQDLRNIIQSLGLANKRAKTLKRFSREYMEKQWKTAKELHGCGKYANDTWRIFCKGEWSSVEPQDHALNKYHNYLKELYQENCNAGRS